MRIRAAVAALVVLVMLAAACGGGLSLFRQYEYEEEIYLSLDGSATMYVNSSIAALNALRGTSFDTNPATAVDRAAARAYFTTPVTRVTDVKVSRRNGRRFVHLRLDVDDINRLGDAAPFAWSTYRFGRDGELYAYRQAIGPAARKDVGDVGWNGREIVAFRLHLPSKIAFHNTTVGIRRGNILVWEQPLTGRLRGGPLLLEARMETQSILYRTLWLFGWTFVAVAISFGVAIWWILKRAPKLADQVSTLTKGHA